MLPIISVKDQRGAALLLLLLLIVVGVLAVFVTGLNRATQQNERDRITAAALAQAKEALIGFAVSHDKDALGYLPLPDLGSSRNGTPEEGNAAGNFAGNTKNLTVIGRLPWRTLGLPPLRDGQGECLWYAISGSFQINQKADVLNWDSLGHFDIYSSNGTLPGTVSITGANFAQRPVAIVFSAGGLLDSQNRQKSTIDNVDTCGGNYDVRNYLDSFDPNAIIQSIVNYLPGSTNNSLGYAYGLDADSDGSSLDATALTNPIKIIFGNIEVNGGGGDTKAPIVNDRILTITTDEIFQRVGKRSDFVKQIRNLLNDPYFGSVTISGTKGLDSLSCDSAENEVFCNNWKEMLFLSQLPSPSPIMIDSMATETACTRVLLFGGMKTVSQVRSTLEDKAQPLNYLEEPNLAAFGMPVASSNDFSGIYDFDKFTPSSDVIRCIKGGAIQKSFASNLDSFAATGTLVSNIDGIKTYDTGVIVDTTDKTVAIGGATGTAGACLWSSELIPLAGKTLRAYYDFQFTKADEFASTGIGSDRGNGFTFQMVRSDFGYFPDECGSEANMGALALGGSGWNSASILVETDVRKDITKIDPIANHTAIMYGGNLTHSPTNGNTTTACNGTAAGCRHSPANKFEESPSTLSHNQRIEINTGCDSTCAICNPSAHVAPNTYARMSTWVDCIDCDDVAVNVLGSELIKAAQDRDFSSPGSWSRTSWILDNGVLSHLPGVSLATLPNASLRSVPYPKGTFEVALKTVTSASGVLDVSIGGTAVSLNLSAGVAEHVLRITAVSANPLILTTNATWEGKVDNVSIKRLPTIQRCVDLDPKLNSIYFGLTGGFRSGVNDSQGVVFRNFFLRSE